MKRTSIAVLGLFLVAGVQAAGKDGLWEITTKMEMEGMPEMPKGFAMPGMPGQANKITSCLAEGKAHESDQQKECKLLDSKKSGRKTVSRVQCKEGTMTIEHEQVDKDHWRSKMVMTGEHAATVNSEGKRIGACDAAAEGGVPRESQKMLDAQKERSEVSAAELGRMCQEAVAQWPGQHPFDQYDVMAKQRKDAIARNKGQGMKVVNSMFPEVPHCAKAKTDYCAKSRAAGKEMGTRQGYAAIVAKHGAELERALPYCGVELASVLPRHCKGAVADADYAFVAANCPGERTTLAAKFCAGRSYTAVEAKYQPLCARGGGRDYTAVGKAEESTADQGMKKLKGLFGGSSEAGGGREYTAAGSGGAATGNADPGAVEQGVKVLKGLFGF